jgi:formate/nitrite transporter FocA (FNT family)
MRKRSARSETGVGGSVGTRMSADEIYDNVADAAEEELERPASALIWSAIAAGLTIGFSFFAAAFLSSLAPDRFARAAAAAGYPLGFIFVVLARNQLFTENTLEPILPLLRQPTWTTLRKVLGLWGAVLGGNIVGGLAIASLAARTAVFEPGLAAPLLRLAREATEGGFGTVAYKAIFAGWLIALMAWLIASTHSTFAQVVLVWLSTAPIAAFGFRHSIAGAVEAFYRAFAGDASWGRMLGEFIVPAVLGNIFGGVFLVALLNYGQVATGTGQADK